MAEAEVLQGEELASVVDLQAYLASVCPAVLGLEGDGERSAEAFRKALKTLDAVAILRTCVEYCPNRLCV